MTTFMRAAVQPVQQLFSGAFRFDLPWFQRPYGWSEEHLERLLNDIENASQPQGGQRGYYLGNLIVSQVDGSINASVADGHQRLVTLTLVFSVLRDLADGRERDHFHRLVWRRDASGSDVEPHLIAQPAIAAFLRQHVQTSGTTLNVFDQALIDDISAGERNIILNRDWLVDRLSAMQPAARSRLAEFIAQRCFVTVCAVEDDEDARLIFAVSQTTGLRLAPVDLFKADVLSALKPQARLECARIWERCQSELGADGFHELLGHLRSLRTRRLRRDLLELELWRSFRLQETAQTFVQDELPARVDVFKRIQMRRLADDASAQPINRRLQYLGWVTHRGWLPPVLHWLGQPSVAHEQTLEFLSRIDRLAYFNMILGIDGDDRDRRYLRIIGEIDNGRAFNTGASLNLGPAELRAMREAMAGPKLVKRRLKASLMLRINGALEGDELPRLTPTGTLEHILPQSPGRNSAWMAAIPDAAERARLTHALGNLSVLTEAENAEADNRDFDVKRPIFDRSMFLISRQIAQTQEWTADAILRRTQQLIEILMRSMGVTG